MSTSANPVLDTSIFLGLDLFLLTAAKELVPFGTLFIEQLLKYNLQHTDQGILPVEIPLVSTNQMLGIEPGFFVTGQSLTTEPGTQPESKYWFLSRPSIMPVSV